MRRFALVLTQIALLLALTAGLNAAIIPVSNVDVSSYFGQAAPATSAFKFPGSNLIDGDLNDTVTGDPVATGGDAYSWWASRNGENGVAILDLGSVQSIYAIQLQNTQHNGFDNKRGTLDFEIAFAINDPGAASALTGSSLATSLGGGAQVFTGLSLASVVGTSTPYPIETFTFGGQMTARYVIFRAVTFESFNGGDGGGGAGLNEFRVLDTPEPGTISLFGLGLLALAWRKRRKAA